MRHKIYYTILLCALCALGSFRANALTYQLNTTFGNWNDPGSWLPQGVPGPPIRPYSMCRGAVRSSSTPT
jgi:hypothetical protein